MNAIWAISGFLLGTGFAKTTIAEPAWGFVIATGCIAAVIGALNDSAK